MTGPRLILVAVALAAVATGCNPTLVARSLPPPGRTGALDPVHGFWGVTRYDLALSAGTALVISCDHGGPCKDLEVRSLDDSVVEAIPAALARLDPAGVDAARPAASFVIVGKHAGRTWLHVKARSGKRKIAVTIVPAPSPPPTVAR